MTFRLANDEVLLSHSGGQVRLRPSLRAVSILENEYGFERLFRQIDEGALPVIADVIRTTAIDYREAEAFLAANIGKPLEPFSQAVMPGLVKLVRAFIPTSDDDKGNGEPTGKPVPWPEAYRELYHKGTGWLHWTPAQTWQATPNEINHAYAGHIAMLKATGAIAADKEDTARKAVAYSADDLKHVEEIGHDPAFDRSGFASLRARMEGAA